MNEPKLSAGKLSAGPIRSWVRGKPRLAAHARPATAGKAPSDLKYRVGVLLRAVSVLFSLTAVMVGASWAILALTVLATPVVGGTAWAVQRSPWVQGAAPTGTTVVALPAPVGLDPASRALELISGYPEAALVEVVAHPGDHIATDLPGVLTVNEKKTRYVFADGIVSTALFGQYLAVCLTGPCGDPGTPVLIAKRNVLGKVLKGVSMDGLLPVPHYALEAPSE